MEVYDRIYQNNHNSLLESCPITLPLFVSIWYCPIMWVVHQNMYTCVKIPDASGVRYSLFVELLYTYNENIVVSISYKSQNLSRCILVDPCAVLLTVNNMVFNAPQPVAGLPHAHLQNCNDKVANHSYTQPCSSFQNHRLNFVNILDAQGVPVENSLSPDGNPVDFSSRQCHNQDEHRADQVAAMAALAEGTPMVEEEDALAEEKDNPTEDTSTRDTYATTADDDSQAEDDDSQAEDDDSQAEDDDSQAEDEDGPAEDEDGPAEDEDGPAEDEDNSTGDEVDEPDGFFHVCRYCIAATEYEQWFKLANTYLLKKPKPEAETNRSRHFLTRLCRLCEVREETLLGHLQTNAPATRVMNLPTQAQRDLMAHWPDNRCTCLRTALYNGIRCGTHRRPQWEREKPALLARRARKKNYLIDIEQNAHRHRIPSTPATQLRRRLNRLWRACRCGADPVATLDAALVMQCMSCEGIVHVRPGGTQPAVITTSRSERRQNSYTTPGLFVLP
jgi:hypothetical protein